jgi:hypothetical protein
VINKLVFIDGFETFTIGNGRRFLLPDVSSATGPYAKEVQPRYEALVAAVQTAEPQRGDIFVVKGRPKIQAADCDPPAVASAKAGSRAIARI